MFLVSHKNTIVMVVFSKISANAMAYAGFLISKRCGLKKATSIAVGRYFATLSVVGASGGTAIAEFPLSDKNS